MIRNLTSLGIVFVAASLAGCAPEVGSERWCDQMRETQRGDWSTNQALDFARHCVFARDD